MISYLQSGDSLTAARMNTLFSEFDRKLSALMGGKSILFFRDYGPTGPLGNSDFTGGVFFPGGEAQWEGQIFFFLGFTPDNTTTTDAPLIMAGIDRPMSCIFHKSPNYVPYDHAPFSAAAAETAESGVSPSRDTARKLLRISPIDATHFNAICRPNIATINPNAVNTRLQTVPGNALGIPSGRNSLFRFSLEAHTRMVDGEPWFVMEDHANFSSQIFNSYTVSGLCPRMDWQQVELVFDGVTDFNFPANYNRYRFFRIHNFNQSDSLTVNFIGTGGAVVHTVVVPAMECKCVRRGEVDGPYTNGGRYFQTYLTGDPRFYLPNEGTFFKVSRALHASNNVCYPDIISAYYAAGFKVNGWQVDKTLFWDAKNTHCNPDYPKGTPLEGVDGGTECIIVPPPGGGYYGDPDNNATIIGDLIYNRGVLAKCNHVIPTVTENVTVLAIDKVNYIPLSGGRPIKSTIVIRRGGIIIPSSAYSLQFCTGPDVPLGLDLEVEPGNVNCFILKPLSALQPDDAVTVTFEKVGATNSEEVVFRGFSTIVDDFEAAGITVAVDSGVMVFTGSCDLMLKSTNLLINSPKQYPSGAVYRQRVFSLRGDRFNQTGAAPCRIPNFAGTHGYHRLRQMLRLTGQAIRNGTSWGTFTYGVLSPAQERAMLVHSHTVGDVKDMNIFGHDSFNGTNQNNDAVTFTNRELRMTGFGPFLLFMRTETLTDWVSPAAHQLEMYSSHGNIFSGNTATQILDVWFGVMQLDYGASYWHYNPSTYTGALEGSYFSAFTSPRVPFIWGKRQFPFVNGIPAAAAMFFPTASAYQSMPADFLDTGLGANNDDDKLTKIGVASKLDGFGFTDRAIAPPFDRNYWREDILQVISAHWQNNRNFSYSEPSAAAFNVSEDFSAPNDWYRRNRESLLQHYPLNYAPPASSNLIFGIFQRMPMLIEHYNNYASLVNSIVGVREFGFMEFYGGYFAERAVNKRAGEATTPHGIAGTGVAQMAQGAATENFVYYSTAIPADQYRRNYYGGISGEVEPFDDDGYFDAMIDAKAITLRELPASYKAVLVDTPRRRRQWSPPSAPAFVDSGSLIDSQAVAMCLFGRMGFYVGSETSGQGEENPRLIQPSDVLMRNEFPTYRYVSVEDFAIAAESTGFKFRFRRVQAPLELLAAELNYSIIHGSHTEANSEHLNSDLRYAFFGGLPASPATDAQWAVPVSNPVLTRETFVAWDILGTYTGITISGVFPPVSTPAFCYGFTLGDGDKWCRFQGFGLTNGAIGVMMQAHTGVSSLGSLCEIPLPLNTYLKYGAHIMNPYSYEAQTASDDGCVERFEVVQYGMTVQSVPLKSGSWEYLENFSAISINHAVQRMIQGYAKMTTKAFNTSEPATVKVNCFQIEDSESVAP